MNKFIFVQPRTLVWIHYHAEVGLLMKVPKFVVPIAIRLRTKYGNLRLISIGLAIYN